MDILLLKEQQVETFTMPVVEAVERLKLVVLEEQPVVTEVMVLNG